MEYLIYFLGGIGVLSLFGNKLFPDDKKKQKNAKIAAIIYLSLATILFFFNLGKDPKIKNISLESEDLITFNNSDTIQPLELKFDGKFVTFVFDWTKTNNLYNTKTFNGTGIYVSVFQNGEELPSNYDKLLEDTTSILYDKVVLNNPKEMKFEYLLKDKESDLTIKIGNLESDTVSIHVKME